MRWDIKGLVLLHGLALLLFFSWLGGYWQALDEDVFWLFNGWLSRFPDWAEWLALLNQRWIDGVVALLMLLFVWHLARRVSGRERVRILCLLVMMTGAFFLQGAVGKTLPIERQSPTLSHEQALRVSQLVPDIKTKDASEDAFPSDHGIGFATFLLFACYRLPRRYLYVLVPLVLILAMPRLMSGAHWLTDIVCGSVPLTLLTGAWLFHTPLADRLLKLGSGVLINILTRFKLFD